MEFNCVWKADTNFVGDEWWTSSCNSSFPFKDGSSPDGSNWKYCPYCGLEVKVVRADDESTDEDCDEEDKWILENLERNPISHKEAIFGCEWKPE